MMNICPKCGGTDITGPLCRKVDLFYCLEYTCKICGYQLAGPTKDQEEKWREQGVIKK